MKLPESFGAKARPPSARCSARISTRLLWRTRAGRKTFTSCANAREMSNPTQHSTRKPSLTSLALCSSQTALTIVVPIRPARPSAKSRSSAVPQTRLSRARLLSRRRLPRPRPATAAAVMAVIPASLLRTEGMRVAMVEAVREAWSSSLGAHMDWELSRSALLWRSLGCKEMAGYSSMKFR